MELKVKHIVLSAVFFLFSLLIFAQGEHPPEPMMDHGDHPVPCDKDGGGVSPPVGLCLPIDGYIYPFLVVGIIFGAYQMHKMESAKSELKI